LAINNLLGWLGFLQNTDYQLASGVELPSQLGNGAKKGPARTPTNGVSRLAGGLPKGLDSLMLRVCAITRTASKGADMTAKEGYLLGTQEAEYDLSKDRLADAVGHALSMLANTLGSEDIDDATEVARAAGYAEVVLSHLANTGLVPFTKV
jgi:hypothetical protein